jgi:hypothetical protein
MDGDREGPIRPQDGPQMAFLASRADIAIYGGAAGGGKTWALLMEPLRHKDVHDFGCVVFRRTTPEIRNEGGLWDESGKLYRAAGATPREHALEWRFPSGVAISFGHLQHEDNVYQFQGAQIPLICFDELTHFTESQFWYLLSRNRSTCRVRPYIRATCNPDADSWVAGFIAWWIDQETGYPIPERAGILRWFVRVDDQLVWADTPDGLAMHLLPDGQPMPDVVSRQWNKTKVRLSANTQIPGLDFKKWGEGTWSVRVTREIRAHLRLIGDVWNAEMIGHHKEMGHG